MISEKRLDQEVLNLTEIEDIPWGSPRWKQSFKDRLREVIDRAERRGAQTGGFEPEWLQIKCFKEIEERRNAFIKDHPNDVCTCDSCSGIVHCSLAFDGYNTQGDCLYLK